MTGQGGAGMPAGEGELARLLETEERLDARIADAERRAAAVVEAARAEAEARRARVQSELAADAVRLAAAAAAERDRALDELTRRAARERERFADVPEPVVHQLAETILAQLLAPGHR